MMYPSSSANIEPPFKVTQKSMSEIESQGANSGYFLNGPRRNQQSSRLTLADIQRIAE
jgi:hypothetical protein